MRLFRRKTGGYDTEFMKTLSVKFHILQKFRETFDEWDYAYILEHMQYRKIAAYEFIFENGKILVNLTFI